MFHQPLAFNRCTISSPPHVNCTGCQRGVTYRGGLDRINEHYNIPEGTFKDSITRSKSVLNAKKVVIAFCKTFGYDIYQIYLDKAEGALSCSVKVENADIDSELPDSFYGCFYGYFFSSTPEYLRSGHIDQFTLNIQCGYISLLLRYALNVEANN